MPDYLGVGLSISLLLSEVHYGEGVPDIKLRMLSQ